MAINEYLKTTAKFSHILNFALWLKFNKIKEKFIKLPGATASK